MNNKIEDTRPDDTTAARLDPTDGLPAVFTRACRALLEADRLIIEAAYLSDPNGPERRAHDRLIAIQLREVDRLIDRFEADMPVSLDATIALNALLISLSDPYDSLADDRLLRGVSTGIERWLSEAPDGATRDRIEYLMNRPHVLHAELRQAWAQGQSLTAPTP